MLQPFRANQPSTLVFAHRQAKSRNMFAWMPRDLVDRMEREDLAMEHHKVGMGEGEEEGDGDGGGGIVEGGAGNALRVGVCVCVSYGSVAR